MGYVEEYSKRRTIKKREAYGRVKTNEVLYYLLSITGQKEAGSAGAEIEYLQYRWWYSIGTDTQKEAEGNR